MGSSGTTAGLTLALAALAGAALADPACDPARIDLRGDFGQAQFRVEVADDAAERAQGLMFRESMSSSAGMLFIYETPQHARFWMQNTLIPLDMIFADAAGRVTHVHANAVPKDETVIDGGTGVRFVLEINGGLAERMGIAPGTELRHPGIPADQAAWPCGEVGN